MTKDRENQKILHSMNTAVTFRKKHDKSGGMYGQESIFLAEMALQDQEQIFDAISYAYSLGYRRGFNTAKKER